MDVNQAAMFLAGSLLVGIAGIIIAGTVLILNNLFHKFWKPVKMVAYHQPKYEEQTKVAPVFDDPELYKNDRNANPRT
jgi:hypothetical protein